MMPRLRFLLAISATLCPLTVFATGGGHNDSHSHGEKPPRSRPQIIEQRQSTHVTAGGGHAHIGNVTATGGSGGNATLTVGNHALSPSANATGGSVINSGNSNSNASANAVISEGAVQNSNRNEVTNTNTNNVNIRSGDSTSAASSNVTNEVNIAAPRAIAPAAELPHATAQTPILPYQMGKPANVAGIEVSEVFDLLCRGITSGTNLSPIIGEGREGKTMHVFVPHPNYGTFGKRGVRPVVELVHLNSGEGKTARCVCLGILQAEAMEKHASIVNRALLQHQAMVFAAEELDGFNSILLVDARVALSVNYGQGALGSGFGMGPGLSNPFGAALATLGLSVNDTKGHTFGKAQLGNTYIVLANVPKDEIPNGAATLDPSELQREVERAVKERTRVMQQHMHHHK